MSRTPLGTKINGGLSRAQTINMFRKKPNFEKKNGEKYGKKFFNLIFFKKLKPLICTSIFTCDYLIKIILSS